jgi:hypothetical protein
VSLWDRLFPTVDTLGPPAVLPQIEAWTDNSHLYDVVLGDLGVAGTDWPLGRRGAMRVPSVARARNLTCGSIAALPLVAMRAGDPLTDQPYWMYGTDGQLGDLTTDQQMKWSLTPQTPWHRMLWTIDDHLFYGESLWYSTRVDADGRPMRAVRVPFDSWHVEEGRVLDADNDPIPADRLIYLPGPNEGILDFGRDTIRAAYDLEHTAADVARRPFRLELHQTSAAELTGEERRTLVAEVRAALADNDGVLFTNSAIETKTHALDSADLLIGGRNAAALDVARLASMPAAMLDATAEGSSLEYQTIQGRNQQWLDYGLDLYVEAVASRLSMDDILPAGQRAVFDTSDWTAPDAAPTGYPRQD